MYILHEVKKRYQGKKDLPSNIFSPIPLETYNYSFYKPPILFT